MKTKRREFVRIAIPPEFHALYCRHRVSPERILNGFIADLCELPGNHGSDERRYAQQYYVRCGYSRIDP